MLLKTFDLEKHTQRKTFAFPQASERFALCARSDVRVSVPEPSANNMKGI